MSAIRLWLCAVLTVAGLVLVGNRATVWAEEADEEHGLAQRLERLERQVQQLVERQQQFNQRMAPMPERDEERGHHEPMLGPQQGAPGCSPGQCPVPRRARRAFGCMFFCGLLLVLFIVHILLAVWVFGDIRKRGEGSGLFVVLALLIGIPGTALYLLARIGDRKIAEQRAGS